MNAGERPTRRATYQDVIDPKDRTLQAFELREGEWMLVGRAEDDEPVCVRPFDALTFNLGALWPLEDPPVRVV